MISRKLASIQIVDRINPIKGADRIEQIQVLGWTLVAKKGEFVVGDHCVFFEIDSVLPKDEPWSQFMASKSFRVKSAKFKGCLSQGLALPLSILGELTDVNVGDDVTQHLGVTKFEPAITSGSRAAGLFPSFVPKTDEIRLQSIPGILDELRGHPFYITVKCDGTSATFGKFNNQFFVCSRNLELKEADDHYWRIARRYALEECLPDGIVIQGEICGPGIQKNPLGLEKTELFVFNALDIKSGTYRHWDDLCFLCNDLGLKTVPLEKIVTGDELTNFDFSIKNFLELAEGTYAGTSNRREGIVIRALANKRSDILGGRLSFKVISNSFLLNDEE
jgi:RNA ligase (TIGR02306 family)